ncbi:MAG: leucyl aminopeptidase, partial [Thermoflexales bacterium]|nr:leucyl aminopeptidase [Thermoflexales bacterium]MCS7325505.1 leucyl aminopeptidase [Thermoflexales bacterium]MCX7939166.1 leucyl aminopeptidase [Thermoflexales bacterium]MDW8053917.1 leucyl aminopeptidase [Anaerolineae bacterium]MDW8292459.1 leucyl aminopeptidase [Anaerolineae bacterium]
MDIRVINSAIQTVDADAIIVNLFEGVQRPGGATGAVDAALRAGEGEGWISQLIRLGDFKGQLNDVAVLYTYGRLPAPRVILVGLGKAAEFSLDRARQASATAFRKAQALGCKRVATIVHGAGIGGLAAREAAEATVEGALLGTYVFDEFRAQPEEKRVETCLVAEFDANKIAEIEAGARRGRVLAEAVNTARTLINRPPNAVTPIAFAQFAQDMAQRVGLRCTVLDETQIAALGMGGVVAVSQGSHNPPRFVILEHMPERSEARAPLVFVGKGVTFDSGGLSLKPADSMPEMKADMAGAAAVLGAMQAVAQLNVSQPVVGLIPLVENMPDGRAFRPGDVIRLMSGVRAEIVSTDAEGRLILSDALHYAKRYAPAGVVDLATLTGACVVALGERVAAGLFANRDDWAEAVLRAAARAGERLWRLPLYPDYNEKIRSDVADIKNSGGRFGGVGTSAYFLYRSVEGEGEYPWAHIDMAGMMFSSENKGYHVKGAMGYGVRTLVYLSESAS